MSQTGCLIRWVHSEAMVVDGMTKWASQAARDTTMSFAKQSVWRVVQDTKLTAATKTQKWQLDYFVAYNEKTDLKWIIELFKEK